MADEEEAQPQSIQQRIAALKLSQVGQSPLAPKPSGLAGKARPPPPPPPKPGVPARPTGYARPASTNNPPLADHGDHVNNATIGNQPDSHTFRPDAASANGMDGISRPSLPPRTSTQSSQSSLGPRLPPCAPSATSPALPPRRPSEMTLSRKASNDSVSSMATTRSSVSAISNGTSMTSRSERYAVRAPEFNPSALPALPPKRTKEEVQAHDQKYNAIRPGKSTSSSLPNVFRKTSMPSVPTRPQLQGRPTPPLPARNGVRQEQPTPIHEETQQDVEPPRRVTAPPPRKSALTMGFGIKTQPKQDPTDRPSSVPAIDSSPPPVPKSSRPDLAALQASKPTSTTAAPAQHNGGGGSCLHCRDFSGPDNHAARFPRQSIPSSDVGWLAHQLTSPFPSITDKARAIFTWLHHNVAYDVAALRNNAVKPSTPQSTLTSGLAVCEGYAGLFAALAAKAGLEAVVVSGASKGGSYRQQGPHDPTPPFESTHAWNACRLDDGNWKLIDPCWGAGTVNDGQPYKKGFNPRRFTQSNIDFGRSHYPSDNSKQYREDGALLNWEDFNRGHQNGTEATIYDGEASGEGLAPPSFSPLSNPIVRANHGPTTRFMFQKICPHWDPVRCGRGQYYLYVLHLKGLDGTDRNHIPFEQGDGVWWCDVPTTDLGDGAKIYSVTSFDGRDGRGLTLQEYRQKKGRVGMMFGGVAAWDVV
jgi:transglutaminase-like putative cysteine protease